MTAAIGIDATRGDKLAVENLSFQTLPLETPAPPTITERLVPMVDKWINVIRYGALVLLFLLIYMLVLRPIKRQIVATFRELPKQLGMGKVAREALPGRRLRSVLPRRVDDTPALEASLQQLEGFSDGSQTSRPAEEELVGEGQERTCDRQPPDSELDAAGG